MKNMVDSFSAMPATRSGDLSGIDEDAGDEEGSGKITFAVPGHPVAYTRVLRTSAHEPRAQRYFAYREAVGWAARQAGAVVWEGPIHIEVTAWVKNRRMDASNLLKGVEDSLPGICYVNDKQITSASVRVYTAHGDEGVSVVVMRVV